MNALLLQARKFFANDDGPTTVEYAAMLGLIILACVAAIWTMGDSVSSTFAVTSSGIDSVETGAGS